MKYDFIGDIHGYFDELQIMKKKLGYNDDWSHPCGRKMVFLGDLCDRGPHSKEVMLEVLRAVLDGKALMVMGNHDDKLLRYLKGNPVTPFDESVTNALDEDKEAAEFIYEVLLTSVPQTLYLITEGDRPINVFHAAPHYKQHMRGPVDKDGERIKWWQTYNGELAVFGHYHWEERPRLTGHYCCLDSIHLGYLSALRMPEMEIICSDQ